MIPVNSTMRPSEQHHPSDVAIQICFYVTIAAIVVGIIASPFLIFRLAPIEPIMGFIQKIFFFHVPCAWSMFFATGVSALGSAAYLFRGRRWGNALAVSGMELGMLFGTLVLITGPLWAKKSWGHYWVWDVRLTTVLVLFLILISAYLARHYGGPSRYRISAGMLIFGAADVPLIYFSVKLWRTIHPASTVVGTLPSEMRLAFFISLATFTALSIALLWIRYQLERAREDVDEAILTLEEQR